MLTRNNYSTKSAQHELESFFGKENIQLDEKNQCIWIGKEGDNTACLDAPNGDQDFSDYEQGELPNLGFLPFVSSFTYHSYSFAAEVVKGLLPILGEGSLCDNDHGEIISAEAFIAKYGNHGK